MSGKQFRFTGRGGTYVWDASTLEDTIFEGEHWGAASVRRRVRTLGVGKKITIKGETLERLGKRNTKRLATSNSKRVTDAVRQRVLRKLDSGEGLSTKDFADVGLSFETFLLYAKAPKARQYAAEEKLAQRLRGASRNVRKKRRN